MQCEGRNHETVHTKTFRHAISRIALTGLLLSCLQSGSRTLAAADTEPNNTFANRELLPSGTTVINGTQGTDHIDFSVADFVFHNTLTPGSIVSNTVNGLTAGDVFALYTDNSLSGVDTMLRTLDENGDEIGFNDDGSPLGDDLGSGISGMVNDDGSVRYEVTGYPDSNFDGSHLESGDFDTYLKLVKGDVDFYTLTGLGPNSQFTAEIIGGNTDTVLGLFDSMGTLLSFDDDGGVFPYSRLTGRVGSDGMLNLAVTSYADYDFTGNHSVFDSRYVLRVQNVPEPGSVAFALTAGMALLGLARKRRK